MFNSIIHEFSLFTHVIYNTAGYKIFFVLPLQRISNKMHIHHNLFIILLLGSKEETVLVKQPCHIQTKMYIFYRKMTIYGHFSIKYIHFWDPSLNRVTSKKRFIMNNVIKRLKCISALH